MKKIIVIICLQLTSVITGCSNDEADTWPKYLGQKTPGTIPEKFAPDIISTNAHEFSCCFSPDGKEFYFSRRDSALNKIMIMVSKYINDEWTMPEIASFTNSKYTFEPSITPDNRRLYYQYGEAIPGQTGPPMNVLYVDRTDSGWSVPVNPGASFNPAKAMHISTSKSGTLYTTDISGGPGTEAIGEMKLNNGVYTSLVKLGAPINTVFSNSHPFIDPDGEYLIYGSVIPTDSITKVLFVSFKQDSVWGEPKKINLGMVAGQPFVTPDKKFLFFTSGDQGKGDIYWVSAKIIEELRPKE